MGLGTLGREFWLDSHPISVAHSLANTGVRAKASQPGYSRFSVAPVVAWGFTHGYIPLFLLMPPGCAWVGASVSPKVFPGCRLQMEAPSSSSSAWTTHSF